MIGDIVFVNAKDNGGNEYADLSPACTEALQYAAELLHIDIDRFAYSLKEKKVQMGRGSILSIKLQTSQAQENLDSISKTLYSNLFDWLVAQVNVALANKSPSSARFVGILDIFGFEVFELNSFEQLCINYANEKLQYHFNEVIFTNEKLMYEEECIPTESIVFEDNAECVALIEGRPYGLLSLLDEQCTLTSASDLSYAALLEKTFGVGRPQTNRYFVKNRVKPESFSVRHFAGAVEYHVGNFLEKNKDSLSVTAREALETSESSLMKQLLPTSTITSTTNSNTTGGPQGKKSTLGNQFRSQLVGLLDTLHKTEPHFIRCVKPNHLKKGGIFNGPLSLCQLRYAGTYHMLSQRYDDPMQWMACNDGTSDCCNRIIRSNPDS